MTEFFPFVRQTLPNLWKTVENKLTQQKSDASKYKTLENLDKFLCEECSDYKNDNDRWTTFYNILDYLVKLGKVLHFKEITELKKLVFFDPNWLNTLLREVVRHNLRDTLQYNKDFNKLYNMDEEGFRKAKRDLDQGLVSKKLLHCIWHNLVPREDVPILSSLLQHFDIGYKLTETEAKFEKKNYNNEYILIPSIMPSQPPEAMKTEWPENCPDEEVEIKCHYACHSNVIIGLFELLMSRCHNGADYQLHWKNGFYGVRKRVKFWVKIRKARSTIEYDGVGKNEEERYSLVEEYSEEEGKDEERIVIAARVDKTMDMAHKKLWEAVLHIHSALDSLVKQHWQYFRYDIYNHCPICKTNHHLFNFKQYSSSTRDTYCEKTSIPKLIEDSTLVYPPSDVIEEIKKKQAATEEIRKKALEKTLQDVTSSSTDSLSGIREISQAAATTSEHKRISSKRHSDFSTTTEPNRPRMGSEPSTSAVQGPNQENTDSENVEVFKRTLEKEFSKRLEKHQQNAERPQEGRRTAWCTDLWNIIVTTVFLFGAVLLALGIRGVFNIVAGIAAFALSLAIAVFLLCGKCVRRKKAKILSDEFKGIQELPLIMGKVANELCEHLGQGMPEEIREAEKLAKTAAESMFADISFSTWCSILFGNIVSCCNSPYSRANSFPGTSDREYVDTLVHRAKRVPAIHDLLQEVVTETLIAEEPV